MYCYYCMKETAEQNGICSCCGKEFVTEPNRKYLQPGTILNGRYVVGNVLGSGGFGITYTGRDKTLDTLIAVKEFFPSDYASRDTLNSDKVVLNECPQIDFFRKEKRRFLTEARTLAKFNSESNIVHARDCFELNDTVYIVMEFVEGENLLEYVKKNGTIEPERLVAWFLPILRVLGKVHGKGLIHRDISPDNIIVSDNSLVLIDFGAARRLIDDKTRFVTMKKGYTPVEQCIENSEQGPWMDIYAVCATMYRCITGTIPQESVSRLSEDRLQKPSELGIQIPKQIENALMHGLAVKYKERTQNISELIAELTGEVQVPVEDPETVLIADPATALIGSPVSGPSAVEISRLTDEIRPRTGEKTEKLPTEPITMKKPVGKKQMMPVIITAGAVCAAAAAGLGILHFARAAEENSAAAEIRSMIEEVSSLAESSEAAVTSAEESKTASAGEISDITGKYLFRNCFTDEYISYLPESGGIDLNVFPSNPECVMEIISASEPDARYIRPMQSSDKVLNPDSPHPADGDVINLYQQNTDGTQYWLFEKSANGMMYVIRSHAENDLALTAGGDGLHLEPYTGEKSQCWILTQYRTQTADESTAAESSTAGTNDKDKPESSASESAGMSEDSSQGSTEKQQSGPEKQTVFEAGTVKAEPGDSLIFPIYVKNIAKNSAYGLRIRYDPALKPKPQEELLADPVKHTSCSLNEALHLIGIGAISDGETTYQLRFDIPQDTAPGFYPIQLELRQLADEGNNDLTEFAAVIDGGVIVNPSGTD